MMAAQYGTKTCGHHGSELEAQASLHGVCT
jgi:hypothetical protein